LRSAIDAALVSGKTTSSSRSATALADPRSIGGQRLFVDGAARRKTRLRLTRPHDPVGHDGPHVNGGMAPLGCPTQRRRRPAAAGETRIVAVWDSTSNGNAKSRRRQHLMIRGPSSRFRKSRSAPTEALYAVGRSSRVGAAGYADYGPSTRWRGREGGRAGSVLHHEIARTWTLPMSRSGGDVRRRERARTGQGVSGTTGADGDNYDRHLQGLKIYDHALPPQSSDCSVDALFGECETAARRPNTWPIVGTTSQWQRTAKLCGIGDVKSG